MTYDYDNAPTDPAHGGKLTAEMAAARIAELEAALRGLLEPTPDGEPAKLWSEKIRAAQKVLRR